MSDQTVTTVEEIIVALVDAIETDTIKPYGIFRVIEGVVEALGVERTYKPQMFYNYSRNGLIAKREMEIHEGSGKKINKDHEYHKDEVIAFVTRYANKNLVK